MRYISKSLTVDKNGGKTTIKTVGSGDKVMLHALLWYASDDSTKIRLWVNGELWADVLSQIYINTATMIPIGEEIDGPATIEVGAKPPDSFTGTEDVEIGLAIEEL